MLVVAHGNSLRALVKMLDDVSEEAIVELNIPTGVPLLYELDDALKPRSSRYLGDPEAIRAAAEAVKRQTEKARSLTARARSRCLRLRSPAVVVSTVLLGQRRQPPADVLHVRHDERAWSWRRAG